MPAPMVVAALIAAGSQLLMNRNQPAGAFQPASFDKVPAPTFQPPPPPGQGNPLQSLIMQAFLQKQAGLGDVGTTVGRTGLGDFSPMRQPPPIGARGF